MNLKKVGTIFLLGFLLLPTPRIHAQTTNAGFIPSNIWYSKDPFEESDKIKIYTLIFNPDTRELSGTVVFYDKTILLGKKNFTVAPKGVKDISVDWTADVGDHTIFAKIESAKFLVSAGKYENITLAESTTEESKRTVNKKIIPKPAEASTTPSATSTEVNNIANTIEEKTPNFISKPVALAAETVEATRASAGEATEAKKDAVDSEIKELKAPATPSDPKTSKSILFKPWKYVELFFLAVFSFILNNKYIFYTIFAIVLFKILRFIWRRIF